MEIIETLDHEGFTTYLKKYSNTICGRHPIGVFLGLYLNLRKNMSFFKNFELYILINSFFFSGAVNALRTHGPNGFSMQLKFRNYDQSNQCSGMRDSSVSYAAASFTMG